MRPERQALRVLKKHNDRVRVGKLPDILNGDVRSSERHGNP
jgi:hypothetical protein